MGMGPAHAHPMAPAEWLAHVRRPLVVSAMGRDVRLLRSVVGRCRTRLVAGGTMIFILLAVWLGCIGGIGIYIAEGIVEGFIEW